MQEWINNSVVVPELQSTLKEFLLLQKRYPVIAVTWPAWVWKTTITKEIASYLWAIIYTELPENNPFLKILKDTSGKVNDATLWVNNQNYFLATDVWEITKAFIKSKEFPIVFDFSLTQTFIFSDINLSWNYLKAFNSMYAIQFKTLPKPDIVVEVVANDEIIIERLTSRWKHIDEFVIKMVEKLNWYYKSWIVEDNYYLDSKYIRFNNSTQYNDVNSLKGRVIGELSNLIK